MSKIPLLLGDPIPLPEGVGGDFAGAAVRFDLGRVQEWQWDGPEVTAECLATQRALEGRRAALPPDADESVGAAAERRVFNRDQRTANRRWPALICAHLVYGFVGGADLPPTPQAAEIWEQYPASIVRWIQVEGLKVALAQVLAPFLSSAASSSGSTDA